LSALSQTNQRFSKTVGRRIFQSYEGNTELQITEVGHTVSDECAAIAISVGHYTNYSLQVVHSFNISWRYILFDDVLEC